MKKVDNRFFVHKKHIILLIILMILFSTVSNSVSNIYANDQTNDDLTEETTTSSDNGSNTDDLISQDESEDSIDPLTTYEVVFYDQNGNEITRENYEENEIISSIDYTAEDNSTFIGWFEENSSEAFNFSTTKIDRNYQLYAKCESKQTAEVDTTTTPTTTATSGSISRFSRNQSECNVTFYVDNEVYNTTTVEYETLLPDIETPTSDDPSMNFIGWYEEGATQPFDMSRPVTTDKELHARFTQNHVVTFYDADGYILEVMEVVDSDTIEATLENPGEVENKIFESWADKATGTTYNFSSPVTSSMDLIPIYKEQKAAIFITNGGTKVSSQIENDDFYATEPSTDPDRLGYTFAGWYTDTTYTTTFDFDNTVINGITYVYAKWDKATTNYTVIFWYEDLNSTNSDPTTEEGRNNYSTVLTSNKVGTTGDIITYTDTTANAYFPTLISSTDTGNLANYLYYGDFKYSDKVTLSSTGNSIVNIYYTRTKFTFNFNVKYTNSSSAYASQGNALSGGKIYTGSSDNYIDQGDEYSITVVLGQDVTDIWPTKVTSNSSQVFSNWSGYYGNGNVEVSITHLTAAFSAPNPVQSNPYYYTPSEVKRTEVTVYPKLITQSYTIRRYYYVEVTEDEKAAYLADPSNPEYTDWVKHTATGASTTIYAGERIYKPLRYGTLENQSGNNPSGWPGTTVSGFEQIGAYSSTTHICKTTYSASWTENGFLKRIQTTDQFGEGVTNGNHYDLHYYMPRKSSTLTLKMDGGEIEGTTDFSSESDGSYKKSYSYESTITLPDNESLTKTNAEFEGWYLDENFTTPYTATTMPASDLVLYAKFNGVDVEVNYYENTSDSSPLTTNYYGIGEVLTSHNLSDTIMDGVEIGDEVEGKGIFLGWTYRVEGTNVYTEFPDTMELYDTEYDLYAKWEKKVYEVTFVKDDITDSFKIVEIEEGNNNTLALNKERTPVITKTGYTLLGWSTIQNSSVVNFTAATKVTSDITVYPVWRANTYTITYELDGGINDSTNPESYIYAVGVDSFSDPSKDGYRFDGWYDSNNFDTANKIENISISQTENITLYAKWVKQYTVTYNANTADSGTIPSDTIKYETNDEIIIQDNTGSLEKTGYTFMGWTTSNDGSGTVYEAGDTIPVTTSNVTLYAKWEVNNYDVIYELDGGTNDSTNPKKYTYGIGVTAFEEPTKTGYTFKGWYDTATFDNEITDISTTQLGAVTLYAKWEVNNYDIIYNLDDGINDSNNPTSYAYGVGVTAFSNPTKEGYTFEGWYDSATFDNEVKSVSTLQTGTVTLFAKWKKIESPSISTDDENNNNTDNDNKESNTPSKDPVKESSSIAVDSVSTGDITNTTIYQYLMLLSSFIAILWIGRKIKAKKVT